MTNRDLDARISRAVNGLVPADGFDKIVNAIPTYQEDAPPLTVVKPRKSHKRLLAAVAACVLLAGAVLGGFGYRENMTVASVVDIDVNPSIELKINRRDRVLSAEAFNDEGEQVLEGLSLRNAALDDAVASIVRSMAQKGFIVDESGILVTLQNNDEDKTADLRRQINTGIGEVLAEHDINASVVHQLLTAFDEAKQFAAEHGISCGKAAFILEMVERAPELNADKLAGYHFAALASVAGQKGIDLHELVDYDDENAAWGDLEDTLQQQLEQAEQILGVPLLTPDEVKLLTGFDEEFMSKVVFVKLELAWEGNIPVYQMEFISDEAVYKYAINAIDGSWMETEEEKENATSTRPQTIYSTLPGGGTTATSARPSTTTTAWMDSFIGEEKAKAIALKEREEAGADPAEAKNVTVKLYYNGEKSVYIVTFVIGDVRYCHDIHAVSGKIIKVDKTPISTTSTTATTTAGPYISRELAINRAVLNIDQSERDDIVVSTFYAHLHDDQAPPYWRVEFHTDTTRYEYKIHAVSGEVLSHEELPYTLQ